MSCFLGRLLVLRAIVLRWLGGGLPYVTQLTIVPRCLLLLVPVVVGQVLALQLAQAKAATDLLPNLSAQPPGQGYLDSETERLLLRFDGWIYNAGPGPLEIQGVRTSTSDPMVANQRIYQSDDSYRDVVMPGTQSMIYATGDGQGDGHNHWHLQDIVKFSLWNEARTREVTPASKVGYCLQDDDHFNLEVGPPSPVYNNDHGQAFCEHDNPDALSVWEGISAGWRDLYKRSMAFQWVDVSDVEPGVYWLREDVDPDRFVTEDPASRAPEYGTAYATAPTTIPGDVAKPIALRAASRSTTAIRLRAARYGPTGPVQFRVDTPPAHGVLNVQARWLFTNPNITYRPYRGYHGPDRFTYVALDSASRYPRHQIEAAVSLSARTSARRVHRARSRPRSRRARPPKGSSRRVHRARSRPRSRRARPPKGSSRQA